MSQESQAKAIQGVDVSDTAFLKQEILEDYKSFKTRIAEIEKVLKSIKPPKPTIYIVYSGSHTAEGRSWCTPCNFLADHISQEIIPKLKPRGYLLWVRIGQEKEWGKSNNPFRTDSTIKLNAIPAVQVWGTPLKRIAGFDALNFPLVQELFTMSKHS